MAQWFNVSSATTKGEGLQGHFDIDGGEGWFQQDLAPFIDKAKEDRHYVEQHGREQTDIESLLLYLMRLH